MPSPGGKGTEPSLMNQISPYSHSYVLLEQTFSCVLVAQSRLTLCDPMDGSPPGSSVHGILEARILEWVAIPKSRGI